MLPGLQHVRAQYSHNLRKVLAPIAKQVGFPGSFHGLRHWFATFAMLQAPDIQVAKVLGHAKTSVTTDMYGHLRDDEARKIAVAFSVAVNGGDVAPFASQNVPPVGVEPTLCRF